MFRRDDQHHAYDRSDPALGKRYCKDRGGSPQPIDEVSKTVNVISGQEMRAGGFFAGRVARSIPGFRIQQLGGFGRTANIKTRGLRNQDTAVLVDGVRLRDASAITGDATPFLSDLTLTSVSSVEVLRGSGSSLYGTNAIGGTVNFITPTPRPGPHGQLSYAAGGLGQRFRGNFSDGTENGKFGFNLALARTAYTKGIDGADDAFNTNFQSRSLLPADRRDEHLRPVFYLGCLRSAQFEPGHFRHSAEFKQRHN